MKCLNAKKGHESFGVTAEFLGKVKGQVPRMQLRGKRGQLAQSLKLLGEVLRFLEVSPRPVKTKKEDELFGVKPHSFTLVCMPRF